MEDLAELKNLWRSADVEAMLPTSAEARKIASRFRRRQILKKSALILVLLLMTALTVYAVFYGFKMLTTRIGEAGFFICIAVLIYSNAKSLDRAFKQINSSNEKFIEYLKQAQRGRIYFYEKLQPALFLIASLSLFLYVFELVYENLVLTLCVYLILTVYSLVMWFTVRPRVIRKKTKQLKETIERLEALSK